MKQIGVSVSLLLARNSVAVGKLPVQPVNNHLGITGSRQLHTPVQ
jgi:hypothetical protein